MATPPEYFEAMWARGDDPWDHGSRWYETRKYDLTVSALPAELYRRAFEPGCGAGWLTTRLVKRCTELVAMELHPRGVEATRRRCARRSGVEVIEGRMPEVWPPGHFDLLVMSEVLYYLSPDEVSEVLERATACTSPGAHMVAVHYRLPVPEHARPGDDVQAQVLAADGWRVLAEHREAEFVLHALERA